VGRDTRHQAVTTPKTAQSRRYQDAGVSELREWSVVRLGVVDGDPLPACRIAMRMTSRGLLPLVPAAACAFLQRGAAAPSTSTVT
jgi:hypothetical protein